MGILDQLRNWTPADESGRTDFDDDIKREYRPRVPREMQRVVKGATDLRDAVPARMPSAFAGQVRTDGTGPVDRRPYADELGQPSEPQRRLIVKLVDELMSVDPAKGAQAAEYTVRMTRNAAWERGRGKNASRWIDTLLTVLRTERAKAPVTANVAPVAPAAPVKPAYDAYDDVTDGNYAIVRAGKTHFYRITRRAGRGQYEGRTFTNIQERASDELFPVRGPWAQRKAILDSIRTAGVEASHVLYAEKLGACWRCNKTLTDDTGNPYRPYGLGPDCGPKVMGAL